MTREEVLQKDVCKLEGAPKAGDKSRFSTARKAEQNTKLFRFYSVLVLIFASFVSRGVLNEATRGGTGQKTPLDPDSVLLHCPTHASFGPVQTEPECLLSRSARDRQLAADVSPTGSPNGGLLKKEGRRGGPVGCCIAAADRQAKATSTAELVTGQSGEQQRGLDLPWVFLLRLLTDPC